MPLPRSQSVYGVGVVDVRGTGAEGHSAHSPATITTRRTPGDLVRHRCFIEAGRRFAYFLQVHSRVWNAVHSCGSSHRCAAIFVAVRPIHLSGASKFRHVAHDVSPHYTSLVRHQHHTLLDAADSTMRAHQPRLPRRASVFGMLLCNISSSMMKHHVGVSGYHSWLSYWRH